MSYFDLFPNRTDYPVWFVDEQMTNRIKVNLSFPDFYRFVALLYSNQADADYYYNTVQILDGERPDQLSKRIYGTTQYHWTFFLINDHLRLGESLQWPLSFSNMDSKINHEFDGFFTITSFYFKHLKGFLPRLTRSRLQKDITKLFRIGEMIKGQLSNVRGTLFDIRPEFGQFILKDVVSLSADTSFRQGESILGETTGDSIICDFVIRTADSIYQYLEPATGREINCRNFMLTDSNHTTSGLDAVTYREYIHNMNDSLRSIRVFRPESARRFIEFFRKQVRKSL